MESLPMISERTASVKDLLPDMEKCSKTGCQAIMYKSGLCRNHLLDKIGVELRRVLRLLYKDPESAFCVFNSTNQTTITIDEMLANKLVLSRVGH
jgi:hypothetical protein